jgi:hypothetical protein
MMIMARRRGWMEAQRGSCERADAVLELEGWLHGRLRGLM